MSATSTRAPSSAETVPVLVLGMGSYAYGRERRAVTMMSHASRLAAHFLVTKWGDGSVPALLRERGQSYELVPLGYLGRARPWWTVIALSQAPSLYARVVRACARWSARGIIVLDLTSFLAALPSLLVLRYAFRTPIVLYLGDIPSPRGIHRRLARVIDRMVQCVVVNSRAVEQALRRIGVDRARITVVYNGVEWKRFAEAEPEEIRQRKGWIKEAVVFGYVGQIRENKGAGDFLSAAERILAVRDDCRFVVVGSFVARDPFREQFLERIASAPLAGRVAFLEWVPRIERIYRALDGVVVPSRYADPAPNVVLEAMASGVPVIGTNMGGIPELLDEGAGFIVDPGRADLIAERLVQLADDRALREAMGRVGRRVASERFDPVDNARAVERIVLEALGHG